MSGGLDVLHARVALRHRPLADVLDLSLRFVVVHARVYARVALVALLPGLVFTSLVGITSGWVLGWLVALAWATTAEAPFTLLASRLVFADQVRARDVIRSSAIALPSSLLLRSLTLTATALGALLLVVPAVWVATLFCFSSEVLLLERSGIVQTLARAQRVAQSDIGETLFMTLLVVVLLAAAAILGDIGGRTVMEDLLEFRAPPSLFREGGSVLAMVGLFGVVPYLATARFFAYLNVRTRAEGWDIQTRFAAIAARAEDDAREAA